MVTQQIHLSEEANRKIRQLKGIYDYKNISQVIERVVMEVKDK